VVCHSSYDQNVSLPVAWTAGPQGTESYAILLEDPDAKTAPLPVVHWIAWNIPASLTGLHEGMVTLDRIEDPQGMRQGVNSMGTTGYKGPRPPAGDPAHHYHLEVFALDRQLDLRPGAGRQDVLDACDVAVCLSVTSPGRIADGGGVTPFA